MTIPRLLALAAILWAALLTACGNSKSGATKDNDASTDGSGLEGGNPETGTTGIGVVTFTEQPDGGGTFFAGFSESGPKQVGENCVVTDGGACSTTVCTPPAKSDAGPLEAGPSDAAATDAAPTVAPNPGTMTVTGGVFGSAGVAVAPDKTGTYLYVTPGTLFSPGDTLGVSAAGGAIPAFSTQTLTAAPVVELTAPTATGGKFTIMTAQPLTVSWTGGQVGAKMVLTATAVFTSGGGASTTCAWDASLGTATVPSSALKPLAAANAQTSGMSWYQAAETQFSVGTVGVTMSAYVPPHESLASFE